MGKFYFEKLGTTIGLNLLNFDEKPLGYDLAPMDKNKKTGFDMYLYEDKQSSFMKRMKKGRMNDRVKKVSGGSYLEFFDVKRKKTFCFFESGLPLNFLVSRGVNLSLIAFQKALDIIFLHAASVVMKGKVCLFVAPSGGGKTTICSLAHKRGLRVLNDEFCIVKKKKNRFYASVSPCYIVNPGPYEEWEIGGIFFLEKSEMDRANSIPAIEAIRRALPEATCFQHDHVPESENAGYRRHVFEFLNSLFTKVDFKLLKFSKERDIFSCLMT
ncbi:MAG: hypothetical protein ACE5JK_01795 [Candidatus Omnitrophota bacterium]